MKIAMGRWLERRMDRRSTRCVGLKSLVGAVLLSTICSNSVALETPPIEKKVVEEFRPREKRLPITTAVLLDADGVELSGDLRRLIGLTIRARLESRDYPKKYLSGSPLYGDFLGWRIYEKNYSHHNTRSISAKPDPQMHRPSILSEESKYGEDSGLGHGYFLDRKLAYYPKLFVAVKGGEEVLLGTKYYQASDDFFIASVLPIRKSEFPIRTLLPGQLFTQIPWTWMPNFALLDTQYLNACLHRGKLAFPLPEDNARSYKISKAGVISTSTEKDVRAMNNYPRCGAKK